MRGCCCIVVLALLSGALIFGCASYEVAKTDDTKIRAIKTWRVVLKPEFEEYEKALSSYKTGKDSSTLAVLLECDIKLRDAIVFHLGRTYKITVVEDPTKAGGLIRTMAKCQWEHYVSLDVTFYDQRENRIGQLTVKNGGDILVKNDDDFAEYCADAIAKVVLGLK